MNKRALEFIAAALLITSIIVICSLVPGDDERLQLPLPLGQCTTDTDCMLMYGGDGSPEPMERET